MSIDTSESQPEDVVGPQPGPQTDFLTTPADIAIYGGSAGSGKSFSLLLEALRSVTDNQDFYATIFRRTTVSIRNPGALWDDSMKLYGQVGGVPAKSVLEWSWPNGGRVKFAHLEYDSTVFDWHAAQVPYIAFDELTEFSQFQFFYMLSRNRSMCGVKPYMRATCNPLPGWVANFISWWIDQQTGYPIPERAGKLRWFMRVGDELKWADEPDELDPVLLGLPTHTPQGHRIAYQPLSVTFIPATIYDNLELMKRDPAYLAKLLALPLVERERLLGGNWKISPAAGLYFKRHWVTLIKPEQVPSGLLYKRGWDLAATEKTDKNDPDATCSVKIGRSRDQRYYVVDFTKDKVSPEKVERQLKNTAKPEALNTEQWIPQDPGQAGKSQRVHLTRVLDGVPVRFLSESQRGDKITKFSPFSAQAEAGHVYVVEAPWNAEWFAELEGFPDVNHDDGVDATANAFAGFIAETSGLIDYYKEEARRILAERQRERAEDEGTADDMVKVTPPSPNINLIYDQKGRALFIDEGCFTVTRKHADDLRKSGFKGVQA